MFNAVEVEAVEKAVEAVEKAVAEAVAVAVAVAVDDPDVGMLSLGTRTTLSLCSVIFSS